jgi:hypothetical protein
MLNEFKKMMDDFEKNMKSFGKAMDRQFDEVFKSTFSEFPSPADPNFSYEKKVTTTETSCTVTETWKSKSSNQTFTKTTVEPVEKVDTEADIRAKIKLAVEAEDYELAAKLKRELKK